MRGALCLLLSFPLLLAAERFYDDDSITREPPPLAVEDPHARDLSQYFDFFMYTFANPAEKQPKSKKKKVTNDA